MFEAQREPEADTDADSESRAVEKGLVLALIDGESSPVREARSDFDGDTVVVNTAESVIRGDAEDVGAAVVVAFSDADELVEICEDALTFAVAEWLGLSALDALALPDAMDV